MSNSDTLVSGTFSSEIAQQIHQAATSAITSSQQSWHKNSTIQQQTIQEEEEQQQKQSVVFKNGYVFKNADKQLFAHAVMKFCAQDMHNYDVIEVCYF